MSYANIILEQDQAIATVTINRPRKLNALDRETFHSLEECFQELASDAGVRAVILTGAGETAFVAGADISNLTDLDAAGGKAWSQLGQRVFNGIEAMTKPVIAAINGHAFGGGLELAMACHLRVAADNAKLGQPEVKIGWIPGNGGSQRLPRLVGKGRALEMILTGEPITADEAQRIGLVNLVSSRAELMKTAGELAGRILANSLSAVGLCLQAVNHGLNVPFEAALAHEAELSGLASSSKDAREGARAFLEKRRPNFGMD
jgi:enoyl-CoA hydratase